MGDRKASLFPETDLDSGRDLAGNMSMPLHISQLVIYPVKSLSGISLPSAEIGVTGFRHDRAWMIVDPVGVFITQRQHPSMARIGVELLDTALRLSVPGEPPLDIPVVERGPVVKGEVWEYPCDLIDQGDNAAALLSNFLHRSCRLVRMAADFSRQINPKYAVPDSVSMSFADSMPFLLTNEASLDELNSRMELPVEMSRFRPNIVVAGAEPFEEDRWRRVRIGDISFQVVKSCVRCEITTVDQTTGVKGIEPLETLGTYRTGPKGVLFGRHMAHEAEGTVRTGDPVEVLA